MPSSRDHGGDLLSRWRQAVTSALTSRYIVGLAAFGAAVLFRYALRDSLGVKVPYLQFYPAIILAAWYGGLGPGILITTLSAAAAMYFLLPPVGILSLIHISEPTRH